MLRVPIVGIGTMMRAMRKTTGMSSLRHRTRNQGQTHHCEHERNHDAADKLLHSGKMQSWPSPPLVTCLTGISQSPRYTSLFGSEL